MKINIQKLKDALAFIVIISIICACWSSLVELWTNSELAYKAKWSAITILLSAFVTGLYIESIKPPEK